MAIPSFVLGSVVHIEVQLTSAATSTAGVEPGGLTFYLTEPDGATYSYVRGGTTHIASNTASGLFWVDWVSAKEGRHFGGWLGTGSNAGADEFAFSVRQRGW